MKTHEYNHPQTHDLSVPALESAANDSTLVTKKRVAQAASVSTRTVDNWIRTKRIPFLKITNRCCRFHLPSVLAALKKFTIEEVK